MIKGCADCNYKNFPPVAIPCVYCDNGDEFEPIEGNEELKPSDVKGGALYRHFKGGLYRVCGFATHTETGETMVIYENVYSGTIWARPIEMFCEMVGDKPRFKKVNEKDGENHEQDT